MMSQLNASVQYTGFVKGLITDSTDVNNDVNSFIAGTNFEVTKKGALHKRLGLSIEDLSEIVFIPNIDNKELYVKQHNMIDSTSFLFIKASIYFIILKEEDLSLVFKKDALSPYSDFAVNAEYVIFVEKDREPSYLKYDKNTKSFSTNPIPIEIKTRDFKEYSPHATDFRPEELSEEHAYDLINAGWGKEF